MNTQRLAQALTLVCIVAAFAAIGIRQGGWKLNSKFKAAETPADAVYRMVDAARQGDVRAYLNCYTDRMEADLQKLLAEKTESGFAEYLKISNTPVKGVAVAEPEFPSSEEARLAVEFVYADHTERQTMYLRRIYGGWRIARTDAAQERKMPIPYGTPVAE